MFQIVTDSSWDLQNGAEELNVKVIPFSMTLDGGKTYLKEDVELPVRDLYEFMVKNPSYFPKTAQPSLEDYFLVFEEIAKSGKDILCFTLSSKLTGSINSALLAKGMIEEQYPDTKVEVVDTTLATVLQGLGIREIARYRDRGATLEEAVSRAKEIFKTGRIFFTVENLDYLIAGGRVGKAKGAAANALNIRPLILLKEGELFNNGVAHGRKKSVTKIINQMVDYISENKIDVNKYTFVVGYGYDIGEGQKLLERVKTTIDETFAPNIEISAEQIGGLIGIYTGPYPIGIGMIERA